MMLNNNGRITNRAAAGAKASALAGLCAVSLVCLISASVPDSAAWAQTPKSTGTPESTAQQLRGIDQHEAALDLFPDIASLGGSFDDPTAEPVAWDARYFVDAGGRGRLELEAALSPYWHIYSTTQPAGGPTRTKIKITGPADVKLGAPFTPDQQPAKSISSTYNGLTVEEHEGTVVWSAPIAVPADFAEPIDLSVSGLVCRADDENGRCMPVRETLTAQLVADPGPPAATPLGSDPLGSGKQKARPKAIAFSVQNRALAADLTPTQASSAATYKSKPFRDDKYVVEWTAELVPPILSAGQTGAIRFTAKPDTGFHVYKVATDDAESATNIVITNKDGLLIGAPIADKELITKSILPNFPPVSYYQGEVAFQLPIKVPEGTAAGSKTIGGMIAYQACTEDSCHRPTALKFVAKLNVGGDVSGLPEFTFASAKSAEALDAAANTKWVDPIDSDAAVAQDQDDETVALAPPTTPLSQSSSFPVLLGLAFLGGLILNVMPCVLPVVGLKIMGFVSQAGEDRGRILLLNVVYVLGIMSVFAILAAVASVSKFGWGQQFTYFEVKLGLTILMFALALSYLGVWEIPAPGMAGGKTSAQLQNREGLVGAFSKGVFATILSTPCSGPLLGYILAATLNFTPLQTIVIMLTVGLGMSSPYLLIGAMPGLISWLPKPGPWMETLKQLMAFLFLGTVAYFFAQFGEDQKVPVFVTLIAVWFGCWIIGLVPNWADIRRRLVAWTGGIAVASLISVAAFHYLEPDDQLAWQDYSEPTLVQLQNEGKTVMLDFGAKWCATCQFNFKVALNTPATREVLDELDAVAMYADWTDQSDEIKEKLEELNSRSIPLLAIYPGGRPNDPIILRDLVSQQQVIDALRAAGASVNDSAALDRTSVSVVSSN